MRHFTIPSSCRRRPRHRALALATAIACGVTLTHARPGLSGTVIRGRVMLPESAAARSVDGKRTREALDVRETVVYVTPAPGAGGRPLAGRARGREVEVSRDHFEPRVTHVVAGSRVRFRNRDRVYHNVFGVSAAGRADLGDLAPDARRELRFERAGVVHLFCGLHPAAAGFVVVCPNWYVDRPGADGTYRFPSLPRGRYLVHAWHPRRGAIRREAEATGRGTLVLDLRF